MKDHAALVIKHQDNNTFLFIKRSKYKKTLPNIWAFPSGTQNQGEDIYETAKREAYEELGIQIKIEETLLIKELPELGVKLHFLLCLISSGDLIIRDYTEIEELEWLTFTQFFQKYKDSEIGHGLIFLRQNQHLLKKYY